MSKDFFLTLPLVWKFILIPHYILILPAFLSVIKIVSNFLHIHFTLGVSFLFICIWLSICLKVAPNTVAFLTLKVNFEFYEEVELVHIHFYDNRYFSVFLAYLLFIYGKLAPNIALDEVDECFHLNTTTYLKIYSYTT